MDFQNHERLGYLMKTIIRIARKILVFLLVLSALAICHTKWVMAAPPAKVSRVQFLHDVTLEVHMPEPPAFNLECYFQGVNTQDRSKFSWLVNDQGALFRSDQLTKGDYSVSCKSQKRNNAAWTFIGATLLRPTGVATPQKLAFDLEFKLPSGRKLAVSVFAITISAPTTTPGVVSIPSGRERMRIRLERMPPTRTYCNFDPICTTSTACSSATKPAPYHEVVIYDRLEPGSLIREIILQPGKYQVSCHSEPARHALRAKVNFAWRFKGFIGATGSSKVGELVFELPPVDAPPSSPTPGALKVSNEIKGTVQLLKLPTLQAVSLPSPRANVRGAGPAARSLFGPSDEALQELFTVVAEVIAEEIERRGLKVLQERLTKLLCEDLKEHKIQVSNTCNLVKNLRFEELSGAGRQLVDAIVADLMGLAFKKLKIATIPPKVLQGLLGSIKKVTIAAALGHQERLAGADSELLASLNTTLKNVSSSAAAIRIVRRYRIMLALAAECARMSNCDHARIEAMVKSPDSFLTLPGTIPTLQSDFVNLTVRALRPNPGATEMSRLRAATMVVFQVLEGFVPSTPTSQAQLWNVRDVVSAALRRDIVQVSASVGALLNLAPNTEKGRFWNTFSRIAGAVGAYVSTYTSGQEPDPATRQSLRDARKAAISSMITEYSGRSHRRNEAIFSLGASMYPAMTAVMTDDGSAFQMQPLALCAGLGLDYITVTDWGLHVEVMPLNLGSYLTLRADGDTDGGVDDGVVEPTPGNILSPSLSIGPTLMLDDGSLMFFFGPTVGYTTRLSGDGVDNNTGLYGGGAIGVYAPLFDLN